MLKIYFTLPPATFKEIAKGTDFSKSFILLQNDWLSIAQIAALVGLKLIHYSLISNFLNVILKLALSASFSDFYMYLPL